MASIAKRKTKAGETRWVVKFRAPDGYQREKWCATLREAETYVTNVLADQLRGGWVDPRAGKVTLQHYAEEWLQLRPNLRPRTLETYEAQLRLHIVPRLGAIDIANLTPAMIRRWHGELSRSHLAMNTVAKCYRMLSAILATAVADELIARNPCTVKGAGVERCDERPVATVEQVLTLADVIEPRYRSAILLAGFVGLRRGEILGLERRHLNLLHRTLTVEQQQQELSDGRVLVVPPKTEAGKRTLVLPQFIVSELERHIAVFSEQGNSARVFAGERGGPLRKLTLHKHWDRARKHVDLPSGFRFHDLRHTANTLTAANGASLRELMHRMGHASPEAALRYQHATRDRDAVLAAAVGELAERVQRERDAASSA
jgi:integrase